MRPIRASLFLLLALIPLFATAITFKLKTTDNNWRQYEHIYIYQNGLEIKSELIYPDDSRYATTTISLPAGEYGYATTMGHRGTASSDATITLDYHCLTLTAVSADNTPINDEKIAIYENGAMVASGNTSAKGEAHFYCRPGDHYAYRMKGASGSLPDLANGDVTQTISIIPRILSVIPRYGQFPVKSVTKLYAISTDGIDRSSSGEYN